MAEMKFETALKRLEKMVEELERGEFSLEDSLKMYEDGVKLARFCFKRLEAAEKKVKVLRKADNEKVETAEAELF